MSVVATSPRGRSAQQAAAAQALSLLKQIGDATDATDQEALTDEFLAACEPIVRFVAFDLCGQFKADRNTWADDFISIVWLEAYNLAKECAGKPAKADEIGSIKAILGYRGRSKVTTFIDSSAGFNQASGLAGWKRRRKELERTRAVLWTEYNREATDAELVEETNRRLRETRADIARQGMECKVEDLYISDTCENVDDHHNAAIVPGVESDSDLHRVERARLVMLCIAECDKEGELLGKVARLWFADADSDDYDAPPTAASIARDLGIEPSTARAKVGRVRVVSQQVARERFRIRADDDYAQAASA